MALQELVWILHKALEASQLEKRACAEFLAVNDEQERLELLRHRERHAADLQRRLEEANMKAEVLRNSLAEKDVQLAELQASIKTLTEKNQAKQQVRWNLGFSADRNPVLLEAILPAELTAAVSCQVIVKLSDQVTSCLSDSRSKDPSSCEPPTSRELLQKIDNLKVKHHHFPSQVY